MSFYHSFNSQVVESYRANQKFISVRIVRSYSEFVLSAIAKFDRSLERTPEEEFVLRAVNASFNFGKRMVVVDSDDGIVYLTEPPLLVTEYWLTPVLDAKVVI